MSIAALRDQVVVIKYGGNAMIDESLKADFAVDIVELHRHGIKVVVVHGGGPQINTMLSRLGVEGTFAGGFRVTDAETMSVVQMVLGGLVLPEIVSLINQAGGKAVGLTGLDADLLNCQRRNVLVDGVLTDIGLVGEVVAVNPDVIETLMKASLIPVISSFGSDGKGQVLNVNADTAAGAIAGALRAKVLIMLTDVPGLYADWPTSRETIGELNKAQLRELLPTLSAGMVPKMEGCLNALDTGAGEAVIIDGRVPHNLMAALESPGSIGTRVVVA